MKKITLLFLILCMVFAISCGDGTKDSQSQKESESEQISESKSEKESERESESKDSEDEEQKIELEATIFDDYFPDQDIDIDWELLSTETISAKDDELYSVYYSTFFVINGEDKIYAQIAYPTESGTYPGVLFIHGATQTADVYTNSVIKAAKQGFICVTYDQPYLADVSCHSEGPWKELKKAGTRSFNSFDGEVKEAAAYETITAGLSVFWSLYNNGFSNEDQGAVLDTKKIAISGISYGGYMTTMLSCLLADYVSTAVPKYITGDYYGSEHFKQTVDQAIDKDLIETWLQYFDPLSYADRFQGTFFTIAASKDTFGTVNTTIKFHEALVNAKEKYIVYSPNDDHHTTALINGTGFYTDNDAWGLSKIEWNYIQYGLFHENNIPVNIDVYEKSYDTEKQLYEIYFDVDQSVKEVSLWITQSTDNFKLSSWTEAVKWKYVENGEPIVTQSSPTKYAATCVSNIENDFSITFKSRADFTYFIIVADENGNQVSTLASIVYKDE